MNVLLRLDKMILRLAVAHASIFNIARQAFSW